MKDERRTDIKQIDGVWDDLTWQTAAGAVTLDEIEHEILRKQFDEPRIHFAINWAAASCPRSARSRMVAACWSGSSASPRVISWRASTGCSSMAPRS